MSNFLFTGASLQNGRSSNMDSLLIKQRSIDNSDAILAVVCDGVGSLEDGGLAAGMAVHLLNDWFDSIESTARIGIKMRDYVLDVNAKIIAQAKENKKNTATTLTALLLLDSTYFITHVGDSRAYSYCNINEELLQITTDDVSEAGKLTSVIGRVLNILPQYYEGSIAGKTFLICSDGLIKRMDVEYLSTEIKLRTKTKKDMKIITKTLPQYVIGRGERDNISFALLRSVLQ